MLLLPQRSWRSWKSARGVALLAVLALATGIGSTTAIYTVIDGVLLHPLPYAHGERFVTLFGARLNEPGIRSLSMPDLLAYENGTHSFDVFGAYTPVDFNLTGSGQPQLLRGIEVSPALAGNLGVSPLVGRWFTDSGDAAAEHGNPYLAVISEGLWRQLGASAGILGQTLTLNSHPYTVVGVMPPWFRFPAGGPTGENVRNDVWVPLNPQGLQLTRADSFYFCYARLKPGVSLAQADADVKRVAMNLVRDFPAEHHAYTAVLRSVRESITREIRPTLLLLLGAAAALLLITCANVAGLLLARSVARARETAVRVALGAGRGQLALQYFVEGLMLSLAGAAGGILLSFLLVRVVLSLAADQIPRADEITVDWTVLAFALAAAVLASLLFSAAPLWQAIRTHPNEVLTDGVRASAGVRARGLSRSLVIAEIALAFTLLALGALLIAQVAGLSRVQTGFNPDHLLTFRLNAPESASQNLAGYQARLVLALNRTPGVTSAAFANQIPLTGCCYTADVFPEAGTARPANVDSPSLMIVSKGYFRTMQIPILEGRVFDERDVSDTSLVAVIDQSLARHYWPGRDAVGAYARFLTADGIRFQVIGIAGAVKNKSLQDAPTPEIFLSSLVTSLHQMQFVVRSPMPPRALINQVRAAVQGVNPQQPIYETKMMADVVVDSIAQQRLQSFMVSFFAAAALLMVTLGVYGVVAYAVRQRTVELGTRMAIGATSQDLFRLVIGDGLKMAGYGVLAGSMVVAVAAVVLRATVFGVHLDDPRPFLIAIAGITGLTALASAFPAWRATMIPPMAAIRNDAGSIWESTRRGLQQLAGQVTGFVSAEDERAAESESELMAGIAEVGRHSGSFTEAVDAALHRVRERIGADSMTLFVQKAPAQPYRQGDRALPSDALLVGRLRHYAGALSVRPSDLDATEAWARENAPGRLQEVATLREINAAMAVRVAVKDEITGLLFAGAPAGRAEYSPFEKRLLRAVAAQFAMMLEISTLTERISEQDRLRRELALAGEVQRRLFPERMPTTANLTFAGVCIPARGVGGDYYDFIDLGNRSIGVALADVAGKGIAAALVMSVVQASLRSLTRGNGTPLIEIAATMNGLLHRSTGANSYATFFYAEVNEEHRELRYVNAGHNPPYLLRAADPAAPLEELTAGGTIIGMFAQSTYEEGVVHLHPGDLLIAFTDGVPEALDPKEEEFGEERLKETLRAAAHLPVDEMAARIVSELKQWISDAAQYDDMTFILMKVN